MTAFDPKRLFQGWQWMLQRDAGHLVRLAAIWAVLHAIVLALEAQTGAGLGLLLWLIKVPFYTAAIALALDGDQRGIVRSFALVRMRLGDVFLAMAVVDLATTIGFLFLLIPGFFIMAWLCLVLPILLMESQPPVEAFRRSVARTRQVYPPILGLVFIGQLAAWLVRAVLNGVAGAANEQVLQIIVNAAANAITGLAFVYLIAAIYSELRHIKTPGTQTRH